MLLIFNKKIQGYAVLLQKSKKYILRMILVCVSLTSVNAGLNAPTDFIATKVTNSTITFSWSDNADNEDNYLVCEKTKNGYENCSEELPENTQNYEKKGLLSYQEKKYVVIAVKNDIAEAAVSNSINIKTTHTWNGELQKCVNSYLGYGNNNTVHIPTKTELEHLNHGFRCEEKGLTSMAPVLDLKNITSLNLASNRIENIPSEINILTHLRELELHFNRFSGPLPVEIGDLSELTMIDLVLNEFTGRIPLEILALPKLNGLYLANNQLTGEIPKEIFDLNLTALTLSYNQFTGSIPVEIGNLINLNRLHLDHNHLAGVIPSSITNLTHLARLYLADNCNLYSNDVLVQNFIDDVEDGGVYQDILDTNTHDNCDEVVIMVPVISYLLF